MIRCERSGGIFALEKALSLLFTYMSNISASSDNELYALPMAVMPQCHLYAPGLEYSKCLTLFQTSLTTLS
jgi:hypothetical protein